MILSTLYIQEISKFHKTVAFVALTFGLFLLGAHNVHAATLDVSGGCTLDIAIDSVNAGSDQSGCAATGGYGSSDTIIIPAGTQTLTSDLPTITEPVIVRGAGAPNTVISGDAGQYRAFRAEGVDVTIEGLKFTAFNGFVIQTENGNISISDIEVDGQDAVPSEVIKTVADTSSTYTVSMDNVYIHNLNTFSSLSVVRVEQRGDGTINADLDRVTLSDIHSTAVGDTIFGVISLAYGDSVDTVINTTISNTTVDDFTSTDNAMPFGSYAIASNGSATVTTNVQNVTITGLRGVTGTGGSLGVKSAAFYASTAAIQSGDRARATVNVINSLMADNLNEDEPSNCSEADLNDVLGGIGTDMVASINSLGYNISDDASCTSFTQPTDQQNLDNIISTLGSLQNNGGLVPTRALLSGSPAIAAGAAVLGVTTDARGVPRPTCPSVGAYQFEGAVVCPASSVDDDQLAETGQSVLTSTIGVLLVLTSIFALVRVKQPHS